MHPKSRLLMSYSFRQDNVKAVLDSSPLSNEPFEFFPPDASEMDARGRYLAAFRIVRRLNSDWVKPDAHDLSIVLRFFRKSAELDPDNAYWPQLVAAVAGYTGEPDSDAWKSAMRRTRWETGEAEALRSLWARMANADGVSLSWQGAVALDHAFRGPSDFVVKNVGSFANIDVDSRFASLLNSAVILDSARSFSSASDAVMLADMAVFGRIDPIEALGQRRYEEVKSAFPQLVLEARGQEDSDLAVAKQQTVESWQDFYRSGASEARSKMRQLRVESLLSASLPSALLMSSLFMLGIGLVGALVASLLGPVLNPDRRLIIALGALVAVFLVMKTGVWLLGLWALTIASVLSIPQMVARDEPVKWKRADRLAVFGLGIAGLLLLTALFLLGSTPASHLAGGAVNPAPYGAVGGLALSLALPCAAVWARIRKVSVMRGVGETLRLLGLTGALIGLSVTIVSAPLALWRDAANRDLLEGWIRNEPATFGPDAPR